MKTIIVIILFCSFGNICNAQQQADLAVVNDVIKVEKEHQHWQVAKNNHNAAQHIFSFLFLGYKNFFSSQDNNHCSFEPSCSEYAIQSLKKYGLMVGIMDACDRLLRCNGMNPDRYDYNEQTGLLIDHP
ncbi:MAG: membrane protein insertion efficiency factor YidD [Bacteroidetes bacterium]|nr:membrane protein insertion efficiency factor YidD [Bacteroidota bacterium]